MLFVVAVFLILWLVKINSHYWRKFALVQRAGVIELDGSTGCALRYWGPVTFVRSLELGLGYRPW
jgi:uncharacterized membrane protein